MSRKRGLLLGIALVAGVLCVIGGRGVFQKPSAPPSATPGAGPESGKVIARESRPHLSSRTMLLGELRSHAGDPAHLLSLVTDIMELRLGQDDEVIQIYALAFRHFTPDQVVEVLNNWSNGTGKGDLTGRLGQHVLDGRDADWFKQVVLKLPGSEAKAGMVSRVARDTAFFDPGSIGAMISGLTEEDRRSVGEGLAFRLEKLSDEERLEMAESYFSNCEDPAVLNAVAGVVTAQYVTADPEGAMRWSLEQPSTSVKGGDRPLLLGLCEGGHVDLATDFVNALLELGDNERASVATEVVASAHFRGNPEGAVEWAAALPADLSSRRHILLMNLSAMNRRDPERAIRVVEKMGNSGVSELLAIVRKGSSK
jgi:hypothetical protein